MALIEEGYPLLVFAPRGPAQAGLLLALVDEMRLRVPRCLLAAAPAGTPGANLPLVETGAIDLDPIALIQSFYPMVGSSGPCTRTQPRRAPASGQGHQDALMV